MTIKSAGLGLVSTALTTAAGEAVGISTDHQGLLITLATIVGTVVGVVTWIDARIEKKIKDHTKEDVQRHNAVLSEIQHLRELLAYAEVIPNHTPPAFSLARAADDMETKP